MKRRLRFALLFGVCCFLVILIVGGTLPEPGKAADFFERLFDVPGSIVTHWIGLGGHDLPTYPIIILVDIVFYGFIGYGLIVGWDAIRHTQSGNGQEHHRS